MTHGKHMFQIDFDIAMEKMCAYPSSKYALPHFKYILRCYAQCPQIDLTIPESYQKNSNVILTIRFNVYKHIAHCNVHGRFPFNEKKKCQLCGDYIDAIVTEKFIQVNSLLLRSHNLRTSIKNSSYLKCRSHVSFTTCTHS